MDKTILPLDGQWRLDYFPQPRSGAVRSLPLAVPHETVQATVPGNCELDLARAGLLPEPETGLNALSWRRHESHQWLYTRSFEAPDIPDGGRAVLRFEGIDTLADIFLNGKKIGETANMLIPHRFDVTDRLRPGENTAQVLIRSVFQEAKRHAVAEHAYMWGTADQAPFRKAAYMGGWDIFPRLLVSGLWRTVALDVEITEELRKEGDARELINRVQNLRKEAGLEITDRIAIVLEDRDEIRNAVLHCGDYIASQVLATSLELNCQLSTINCQLLEMDGYNVKIDLKKA